MKRRDFLKGAATFLGGGFGFIFGSKAAKAKLAAAAVVPAVPAQAAVPAAAVALKYGAGVRAQVFEVIVRQALAGAPWEPICAGPMQVNNISSEEVIAEVARRCVQVCDPTNPDCRCFKCVSSRWPPRQHWVYKSTHERPHSDDSC